MKAYKQDIINALVVAAHESKIVSLKKAAKSAGIEWLESSDAREILSHAAKATGYRIVKMLRPGQRDAAASLWETAVLMAPEVNFE